MGWSCRADAGKTMDAWIKACVEATGSSNVYRVGGDEFFWETSRTEHADGAITGSIVKVTVKNPDGSSYCRKVGTFRIEGDGRIARAPKWLKDAAIARVGRHAVEGADGSASKLGIGSGGSW